MHVKCAHTSTSAGDFDTQPEVEGEKRNKSYEWINTLTCDNPKVPGGNRGVQVVILQRWKVKHKNILYFTQFTEI